MTMHEDSRTRIEWSGVIWVSYRIVYGPNLTTQRRTAGTVRIRILAALSFLVFTWIVRFFWADGREVLITYLQPEGLSLAEAAFYNLLENIRQGARIVDSLTVFCQEVLYEIV